MKRIFLFVLATALLLSLATFFVSAEATTLQPLACVSVNTGSFQTVTVGETIFSNRDYTFGDNIPAYLVGKSYVQTKIADTVTATVSSAGYVYVLTQVDGVTDSQEAALIADGFTRIDTIAAETLWSAHKYETAVMAKEVAVGDTVSFNKWGLLIADTSDNALAGVVAETGTFDTIAEGTTIFSNRNYTFTGNMPSYLVGKSFLKTDLAGTVSVTVATDGYVYVLTPGDGIGNSKEAELTAVGFTRYDVFDADVLWSGTDAGIIVMKKVVTAGETISYTKWGVLVANEGEIVEEEKIELGALATVMPQYERPRTIETGTQIFVDRTTHFFSENLPNYLLGQSYLAGSLTAGSTVSVTADGWVYVLTPSTGTSNSQVTALTADGFSAIGTIGSGEVASTLSESLIIMGKEVKVGDTVSFGKWGILLANATDTYFEDISLTAPSVIPNPKKGEYLDGMRLWQGIPSMTKDNESGRLWATWYSGGDGEGEYNFVLLYTSDDDGETWDGPVIAIDHEYPVRCFDPNLWVDPDGRMWMFWSQSYYHFDGICGTWMMYTDNPESENPTWSTPVRVANGIAMNDPIVLSNGDWILPTAIWEKNLGIEEMAKETNSNAYISKDKGMTWEYLGSVPSYEGSRSCDENMIIEQNDGSLRMLIRTGLGIEESYSTDGGKTWSGSVDADITNVSSRFYITRLSSGNQLLIFNNPANGGTSRKNMTAALSTDDGATWSYKLVIDSRTTTYPDAVEDADGNIYITYDHGRGVNGEIMMAKITEADIIAGELVTETSKLQVLINNNTVPALEEEEEDENYVDTLVVFPGDATGDEKLTFLDAMYMLRHLVDTDFAVKEHNADINGDKIINLSDVLSAIKLFLNYGDEQVDLDLEGFLITADLGDTKKISEDLFGIFLEDVNYAVDGGLYVEMVKNNSFEYTETYANNGALHAYTVESGVTATVIDGSADGSALNVNNPHYLRVVNSTAAPLGILNAGYMEGMCISANADYTVSVFAKGENVGDVFFSIVDDEGIVYGEATLSDFGTEWSKKEATFTAIRGGTGLSLAVRVSGTADIDCISLMPTDTYEGTVFRKDLGETLEALSPKFFRFPGGCIIEGYHLEDAYDWKASVGGGVYYEINGESVTGDISSRVPEYNLKWGRKDTTGDYPYYMTYGIGFYEYFEFCEKLDCIPIPVLNAGISCQVHLGETAAIGSPELQKYIDDMLDLVEFANGGTDTYWGKIRADMGHPEPFGLEYISIGNEQKPSSLYLDRYAEFVKALNAAKEENPELYGNIKLVQSIMRHTKPILEGNKEEYTAFTDIHYYESDSWFIENAHYFDGFSRDEDMAPIYVGEYASESNSLYSAIAEAAHMTGIENNGDIVAMACYAPLLANITRYNWDPNLIWFNNSSIVRSTSYYVQQMFGNNPSTSVAKATVTDYTGNEPAKLTGMVGVGTYATTAKFDNIKVVSNSTGEVLYSDNFTTDTLNNYSTVAGTWQIIDGALHQTSTATTNTLNADVTYFGNSTWTDYTLTLEATKLSGNEGFVIPIAIGDVNNWYHWNVGGWSNTLTALEYAVDGVKTNLSSITGKPFAVTTGQTYQLKLVVKDDKIECYVDGVQYIDYVIPRNETIYQVTGFDANGDILVKVVNVSGDAVDTRIQLKNTGDIYEKAEVTVFGGGNGTLQNTADVPDRYVPVSTKMKISRDFEYTAPPYSLTVFKIRTP